MKRSKLKEIGLNIALFCVVLLVLFALLEGALRLTYPAYANFNTEMWRYSTEIKQISDVPGVSHTHQPDKQAVLYGVDVQTNAMGFRDKEYPVAKPLGTTRILLFGDSVTLGWGVNESDMYSEALERKLNEEGEYEVINTAVGNYNTEMEVRMLREHLELEPDAVIIGFFPNDAEKTRMVDGGPVYWLKSHLYLYPVFWDRFAVRLAYLLRTQQGNYGSTIHDFYTPEYGGKERLEQAFKDLSETTNQEGIDVYVVTIPHLFTEFDTYDAAYIHEYVHELCGQYNFTCVETLDDFSAYTLDEIVISQEDAHPNALGHAIIADNLYEAIR
jgi:lysophospholipase L1-like esterase